MALRQIYAAIAALFAVIANLAPAEAQVVENPWRGFYAGVNGGYAWNTADGAFNSVSDLSGLSLNGATVGGQIGYNWQSYQFLFGIEADASTLAGNTDSAIVNPGAFDATVVSAETKVVASVRARLGWAINNWLLYATVGWGFGEFEFKAEAPQLAFSSKSRVEDNGVVYGGGVEWMVAYGVSLRGEYLRYDLSAGSSLEGFPSADPGAHIGFDTVDVARAALNIKLSN